MRTIGRHTLIEHEGFWYIRTPGTGVWAFNLTLEQAITTAESVR